MALNNAISDAVRAVLGSFGGLVNGTNPISQPQIAQFVGINIPGVPLVSTRDYFLTQLDSWITTPSLQSQWIAVIESFPSALASSIIRNLERTGGSGLAYNIDLVKTLLTSFAFQRVIGCIFCNGFEMPEESYSLETAILDNNRGFIPGVISGNRSSYALNPLTLQFYDNNTSFVDNIIRPWVMLASHYGHVTRSDPFYKVSTNITLLSYSKTYQNVSMIPRKVFRFFNCVPTQVAPQEYDYDEPNSVGTSSARFSFTNYTVENGLYLPLPQIISSINSYRSR